MGDVQRNGFADDERNFICADDSIVATEGRFGLQRIENNVTVINPYTVTGVALEAEAF